jgi:hypothetical protein
MPFAFQLIACIKGIVEGIVLVELFEFIFAHKKVAKVGYRRS